MLVPFYNTRVQRSLRVMQVVCPAIRLRWTGWERLDMTGWHHILINVIILIIKTCLSATEWDMLMEFIPRAAWDAIINIIELYDVLSMLTIFSCQCPPWSCDKCKIFLYTPDSLICHLIPSLSITDTQIKYISTIFLQYQRETSNIPGRQSWEVERWLSIIIYFS